MNALRDEEVNQTGIADKIEGRIDQKVTMTKQDCNYHWEVIRGWRMGMHV